MASIVTFQHNNQIITVVLGYPSSKGQPSYNPSSPDYVPKLHTCCASARQQQKRYERLQKKRKCQQESSRRLEEYQILFYLQVNQGNVVVTQRNYRYVFMTTVINWVCSTNALTASNIVIMHGACIKYPPWVENWLPPWCLAISSIQPHSTWQLWNNFVAMKMLSSCKLCAVISVSFVIKWRWVLEPFSRYRCWHCGLKKNEKKGTFATTHFCV